MVVGRCEGHHSRVADVPDRAGGHDAPLSGHQSRDRGRGPQRARVGEGHGRAHVVVGAQAAVPRAGHQLLVSRVESREIQALRAADDRHDQEAAAVGPLHVHGQAQVDGTRVDDVRGPADLGERAGHARLLRRGAGEGEPDEVGEARPSSARSPRSAAVAWLSRTPTGTSRNEVAVGTASEAVMLAASRAAGPRSGVAPGGDGIRRPRTLARMARLRTARPASEGGPARTLRAPRRTAAATPVRRWPGRIGTARRPPPRSRRSSLRGRPPAGSGRWCRQRACPLRIEAARVRVARTMVSPLKRTGGGCI